MALDDGLGDRQPETAMLSEGLRIGPGRMKALEYLFPLIWADSRSLVGDIYDDLITIGGCQYLYQTAFG